MTGARYSFEEHESCMHGKMGRGKTGLENAKCEMRMRRRNAKAKALRLGYRYRYRYRGIYLSDRKKTIIATIYFILFFFLKKRIKVKTQIH